MTWRDRYEPASFRGVEFKVEAHLSGGGRRLSVHQFPGQDRKYIQDLGRDVDIVRIRAYVVGDDYDRQRDALLGEVRKGGPGVLVHPYLGRLLVRCLSFRVEERASAGGMATLSLEFIEAGSSTTAIFKPQVAAASGAESAAMDVEVTAPAEFAELVQAEGRAGSTAGAIAGQVNALAAFVATAPLRGPFAEVAALQRDAERLADSALNLASAPVELGQRLRDLVFGLAASFESRREALRVTLDLLAQGPNLSSSLTSLGRRRNANAQATADLISSIAAASALRAAAEVTWDYREEAEAARLDFQAGVDRVLETAGDGTYRALLGALSAASNVMPPPGENLPSLESMTLGRTMPALVLAYEQFGTPNRDEEIAARNPNTVRHPGRLPGGEMIEVLSA